MQFAGLDMDAVPGWFDVTADLETGSPPTLAKEDGIGALQFSSAKYAGGNDPRITATTLKSLLRDFQNREGLPQPKQVAETARSASATFQEEDQLLRVWFLSNGFDPGFDHLTRRSFAAPDGNIADDRCETRKRKSWSNSVAIFAGWDFPHSSRIPPLRRPRSSVSMDMRTKRTNEAGTMMRVEDVAARWALNPKTVYAMIERGELVARRFGRVLRVPRSLVESIEQASVASVGA